MLISQLTAIKHFRYLNLSFAEFENHNADVSTVICYWITESRNIKVGVLEGKIPSTSIQGITPKSSIVNFNEN